MLNLLPKAVIKQRARARCMLKGCLWVQPSTGDDFTWCSNSDRLASRYAAGERLKLSSAEAKAACCLHLLSTALAQETYCKSAPVSATSRLAPTQCLSSISACASALCAQLTISLFLAFIFPSSLGIYIYSFSLACSSSCSATWSLPPANLTQVSSLVYAPFVCFPSFLWLAKQS